MNLKLFGFALCASIALAQPPAATQRPSFDAFEVATIKPVAQGGVQAGSYIRMESAHRFLARNYTVKGMIGAAYNLTPRMISGGPAWVESDRFEIVAVTPGDARPTLEDQMTMLRKLLTDRFQLSFRRESKELAIYQLTIAKNGPKLTESTAPPDESPRLTSTVYPAASGGIDKVVMPARNATMAEFASMLQRAILDRPVADRTGLSARYNFDLEWTPADNEFGGTLPPGPPDSGKPGLYEAMQQQLGLKLEATKGNVEALVINHIERPTEN